MNCKKLSKFSKLDSKNVASCTFHSVGTAAGEQKFNSLCILSLNIINEKVKFESHFNLVTYIAFAGIFTALVLAVRADHTDRDPPDVQAGHHPDAPGPEAPDHHQDPRLLRLGHEHHKERPKPLLPRGLVRPLPAQQKLKHILFPIPPQTHGCFVYVTGM